MLLHSLLLAAIHLSLANEHDQRSGFEGTERVIRERLDESANPCEDFYAFTCGKSDTSSDSDEVRKREERAIDEAKKEIIFNKTLLQHLYNSQKLFNVCNDATANLKSSEKEKKSLKKLIENLGGFPRTAVKLPFLNFLGLLWKEHGFSPLVSMWILPFDRKMRLRIDPKFTLGMSELLDTSDKAEKTRKTIIANTSRFLEDWDTCNNCKEVDVGNELYKLLKLQKDLARQALPTEVQLDNEIQITTKQLNAELPIKGVSWLNLLQVYNSTVTNDTKFWVTKQFLPQRKNFFKLMGYKIDSDVRSAMTWTLLAERLFPLLDEDPQRSAEFCFALINPLFSNYMYVQSLSKDWPNERIAFRLMWHRVLDGVNEVFMNTTWLDGKSLANILKRLHYIDYVIGYDNDQLGTPEKVNDAINKIFVAASIPLDMDNVTGLTVIEIIMKAGKVKEHAQKYKYQSSMPMFYDAQYKQWLNKVHMYHMMMKVMVPNRNYPSAFSMGRVGSVMAHEIGHAFDANMIQEAVTDWTGNELQPPLTADVQKLYSAAQLCTANNYKIECIKQYPKWNSACGDKTILTRGEDTADIFGVKAAYKAFKKWQPKEEIGERIPGLKKYSMDAIFFIASALLDCREKKSELYEKFMFYVDPHSNGRSRINGWAKNIPEFAEAFNCPAGSNMVPKKDCKLW